MPTASQGHDEQQLASCHSGMERVVARLRKTYSGWSRSTSNAQMRRDWDALFASGTAPATVQLLLADGVAAAWIRAPGARMDKVALYFHGGGFRVGSLRSHRDLMARVSAASGCSVLGVDYRLAPEHRFPAARDDALTVYRWLLGQGHAAHDIALIGDSAGGGLALTLALALRDAGEPIPAAIATMSAWTDLSASRASYDSRAALDPIHQRRMILAMAANCLDEGDDPQDPRISPLFADLAGLPPLLMQVGERETVLDDSRDFAHNAEQAGCKVTLEIWAGMIHVFQQFPEELPEAGLAIDSLGSFLRRCLSIQAMR